MPAGEAKQGAVNTPPRACTCHTGAPHTLHRLPKDTVKHGVCVTTSTGEQQVRITYTDGTTQVFPGSIFREGYLTQDGPGVLENNNVPLAVRAWVTDPTPENRLKIGVIDAVLTAYHQSWAEPERTHLIHRDVLDVLRDAPLKDYLDVETTPAGEVVSFLSSADSYLHYPTYGYAEGIHTGNLYGILKCASTGPPERITPNNMPELVKALTHPSRGEIPVDVHTGTQQTHMEIIDPATEWVRDVFHQHDVWGVYGLKHRIYMTLTPGEKQVVDKAIRGYHLLHHATLVNGALPRRRNTPPEAQPVIQDAIGYATSTIEDKMLLKAVQYMLPEITNRLLIAIGWYDTRNTTVGFTPNILGAALRFFIDLIVSNPPNRALITCCQEMGDWFFLKDVAERVAGRILYQRIVEEVEPAVLLAAPAPIVLSILGITPGIMYTDTP